MQNVNDLRTVEWKDNKVIMIEQTKLPNELIFVEYDDFHQVANAIKTLIVRGAPAIGVSGAFGLGLAALQSKASTKEELLLDLDEARKILSEHNLDVGLSDSQYAIHINSNGIDKGTGFTEIMKKFNLVKDDVIAIGDSATDVPLFKVAKTSIALGNASDFVRSEATMSVSARSGDGVLEALDKLAPKLSEI